MAFFKFLFGLFRFSLLALGLGSVWLLYKIGGHSDGPGALMFYIGAFFGIGGFLLTRLPSGEG